MKTMFKLYFLVFLLAHLVGDFYLQNETMAENKSKSWSWLFFHSLLYALPFWFIPVLIHGSVVLLLCVTAATIVHFVIDAIKCRFEIYKKHRDWDRAGNKNDCNPHDEDLSESGKNGAVVKKEFVTWIESLEEFTGRKIVPFLMDQIAHLLVIVVVVYILARHEQLALRSEIAVLLQHIGVPAQSMLIWVVAITLVWKPVNLLIYFVLQDYEPKTMQSSTAREEEDVKAGRAIGLLERVIILALVSLGQAAGISLVLAAKTLARFNRIKEDESFAERYLIGTLLSTLFAIITSLIFSESTGS